MTQKSCAVEMRNAILRNYLKSMPEINRCIDLKNNETDFMPQIPVNTCVSSNAVVSHPFGTPNSIFSRTHPPLLFSGLGPLFLLFILLFSRPILLNLTRGAWCLRSSNVAKCTQKSSRERSPSSWIRTNHPLLPHIPQDKSDKTRESPTYWGLKELLMW